MRRHAVERFLSVSEGFRVPRRLCAGHTAWPTRPETSFYKAGTPISQSAEQDDGAPVPRNYSSALLQRLAQLVEALGKHRE